MNDLIKNLDKLHTTELGAQRIRKNMQTDEFYIVSLCKSYIWLGNMNLMLSLEQLLMARQRKLLP